MIHQIQCIVNGNDDLFVVVVHNRSIQKYYSIQMILIFFFYSKILKIARGENDVFCCKCKAVVPIFEIIHYLSILIIAFVLTDQPL